MRRLAKLVRHALFLLTATALPFSAHSQSAPAAGRIVGRVVDAASGAPITDVGIQVVGTNVGTQSGVDGRFTLAMVPAGTVTLHVRRIGFASKTITGILLDAGKTAEQGIT